MAVTPAPAEGQLSLAPGVTREYLLHHRVCPVAYDVGGTLLIAAAEDALLDDALDDLAWAYRCPVTVQATAQRDVDRLIERLAARADQDGAQAVALVGHESRGDDDGGTADVRNLATQPPVVRYVNLLLREAYDAGASDIHLGSTRRGLDVRLRIDGVLVGAVAPPTELALAVVSRIKLLADLDIAERRRPQDGRIRARLDARELDVRISTVPTIYGESVVLRLLDRGGGPVDLADLGLAPDLLRAVRQVARRPHGLLLVTGPTGSGKTTTLYSALQCRDTAAEKIITVEDPIEYELPGVTQVPVHRHVGVTFAAALRSILRQDPDVIMLGEMRDPETAEVAIQAALTGHLVLSTLHTNDAVSAIPRLLDLGVPAYLIAATLEGVLAQRLVRLICAHCRCPDEPDASAVETLRSAAGATTAVPPTFHRGAGCPECRQTGYRGRTGLFEFMAVSGAVRRQIASGDPANLQALAISAGMRSLAAEGWDKVVAGQTTIAEVQRVALR